jgi:RNA polymerase sigma factor (TIGR02999 family)
MQEADVRCFAKAKQADVGCLAKAKQVRFTELNEKRAGFEHRSQKKGRMPLVIADQLLMSTPSTPDKQLFQSLYSELKTRARALRRGFDAMTLNTTAIVHEAFLKIAESQHHSVDRAHLLRTTALAMRQVLLDHARAWQMQKRRDARAAHITLTGLELEGENSPEQLLAMIEALDRLAQIDARCNETFMLRTFAGLSLEEIGALQGVSHMTCSRDYQTARSYLMSVLQ